MNHWLYLFSIVATEPKIHLGNAFDHEVRTISASGLAAVVTDYAGDEVPVIPENIIQHSLVQERLMNSGQSLLPISYGTLVESEDAIRSLLKDNKEAILERLQALEGKVEVGVKLFWNKEALQKVIQARFGELDRLKGEMNQPGVRARELAVEVGQLVETEVESWREIYRKQLLQALRPFNQWREGDRIGARMMLNLSFLIPVDAQEAFAAKVAKADQRWGDSVTFKLAMNLPPYNFVDLRLEPQRTDNA